MLDSILRILECADGLIFDEFRENNLISDVVIRNREIIGEATKNVSEKIRKRYPVIPWKEMYGLRNFVVHEYFGIDYENIWKIITGELPKNIEDLETIIEQEKEE